MSDSDQTFPSLTPTEATLLMTRIEEGARRGAEQAIKAYLQSNCRDHIKRTEGLEAAMFGRTETGLCGLDERVHTLERLLSQWDDDWRWFKRFMWTALIGVSTALGIALFNLITLH